MKQLTELLSTGETEKVEFKLEISAGLFRTICAFANTNGGTVVVGVDSAGQIRGVPLTDQFLQDLTNRIVNKLALSPVISTHRSGEKWVVVIDVVRANFPVSFEGRYYERVGNTTREMRPERLRTLMLTSRPWDMLTDRFAITEIDPGTVQAFIRLAVNHHRLPEISQTDALPTVLEKLGLIYQSQLTNAALLLFGKNPQQHFGNLCVRVGRFKTETTIIDDKWITGNLFQQFDETIRILKQHIAVRYEIQDLQREEVWDYPIPALREAVLNALTHRDYFNVANPITIKVYDDRLWFFNPGGLPEGITVDQLKKPHQSFLRNSLIARVFYLAGFIEQYGSGTVRILEWLNEAGLPEPEFLEEMGGFSLHLYSLRIDEAELRKIGLNERQISAVVWLKVNRKITNTEYQRLVGVKKRQATDDLLTLEQHGIVEKVGTTGKGTFYALKGRQRGERGTETGAKGDTKGT